MKKIIYLFLVAIVFVMNAKAQDDDLYPLSFGPMLSGKMALNGVDTPMGRKNGLAISSLPDFGIAAYIPATYVGNIGALFNLEYSSYSFLMKDADREIDYQHNLHYITLSSSFYFNDLWFGFGAGMPLSADYEGIEIDSDIFNMTIDFRIGYMYPIYQDEDARLNLFAEASYMLTGIYDEYPENDPMKDIIPEHDIDPVTSVHNPRIASFRIGFNYLFNFSSTE